MARLLRFPRSRLLAAAEEEPPPEPVACPEDCTDYASPVSADWNCSITVGAKTYTFSSATEILTRTSCVFNTTTNASGTNNGTLGYSTGPTYRLMCDDGASLWERYVVLKENTTTKATARYSKNNYGGTDSEKGTYAFVSAAAGTGWPLANTIY